MTQMYRDGGFIARSPEATKLVAAVALKIALKHYKPGGMQLNRAYTPGSMLKAATRLTGQAYARGEYSKAYEDVAAWVEAAKTALPVGSIQQ